VEVATAAILQMQVLPQEAQTLVVVVVALMTIMLVLLAVLV
jgi:hypothetical protein